MLRPLGLPGKISPPKADGKSKYLFRPPVRLLLPKETRTRRREGTEIPTLQPRLKHQPLALKPLSNIFEKNRASLLHHSIPLDVLFCGSDAFSCVVLGALCHEHRSNPALINSIQVMLTPQQHDPDFNKHAKLTRQVAPLEKLASKLALKLIPTNSKRIKEELPVYLTQHVMS
jgi:hypothetical protein